MKDFSEEKLSGPSPHETTLRRETTANPDPSRPSYLRIRLKRLVLTMAKLVLMGLVFGWVYDWATPRFYGADRTPSFELGVLHGALMPVALPVLLVGKDVPIYSPNAPNRKYKLGYIAGVNLCGLLFFGTAARAAMKPRNAA